MKVALLALVASLIGAGCTSPSVGPGSTPASSAPVISPVIGAPSASNVASAPGEALLPDPSAEHTLGDAILLSGGDYAGDQANLTVLEAVRLAEPDPSGAPRYAFLVEIEGRDPETLPYNALHFALFDDQNFKYDALDGVQQPELTYGDLAFGRKVRGWLTFLGPAESAFLELEYGPILALEPAHVRVLLP
jgi:hypothetical protein